MVPSRERNRAVVSRGHRIAGTQYLIDVNYDDSAPNCGTTSDQAQTYQYNPASQIVQRSASNDAYAWSGAADGTTSYVMAPAPSRGATCSGPGVDEPLVWYEGAGTTDRRWLHADERGSITAISNAGGVPIAIDAYDEYGQPKASNIGRFQYTGQQWLPDSAMYYYKARMYVPSIGRFAQTDPIGYENGPNWYVYVGGDPIGRTDPSGLDCIASQAYNNCDHFGTDGDVTIIGTRPSPPVTVGVFNPFPPVNYSGSSASSGSHPTVPQNTKPTTPTCGNGLAAKIANVADKVSLYSGGLAATSGLAGLVAAPTGAGFVGFEGVAAVSGLVSLGASGVGAVAHAFNGDYIGAGLDAAGLFAGPLAGKLAGNSLAAGRMFGDLSASQARQAGLIGNGLGTAAGAAGSLYSCR